MARRAKNPKVDSARAIVDSRRASDAGRALAEARVEVMPVEGASGVLTVEADDPCWLGTQDEVMAIARPAWNGSFVRLRPPPGASDQIVEAVRRRVALDAVAVRVMPRQRALVVAPRTACRARVSIRATVEKMVEEANTRDRPALRLVVLEAISAEGL